MNKKDRERHAREGASLFGPKGLCDRCEAPAAVWIRGRDELLKLCTEHVRERVNVEVEEFPVDLEEPPGGYNAGRTTRASASPTTGGSKTKIEHVHGREREWE